MRRLIVLIAAALSATLVYAQDAENVGNGAQLSIAPRIDLNPFIGFNADSEFSLSNSSLSTVLEGSIGDSFSYSVMNHWLQADEPGALYANSFRSDESTWVNWANIMYAPGDISFTLGKNYMFVNIYEEDPYDFESHWDFNSNFWNSFQIYQWGGDITWTYAEDASASFQVTSSPFTERPFQDGVLAYTLSTRNEANDFTYMLSAHLVGFEANKYLKMFAGGATCPVGDVTLGADFMWRGDDDLHISEITAVGTADYSPSEKIDLQFKLGYENTFKEVSLFSPKDYWFGGVAFHYFPTEALRLHTVVTYVPSWGGVSINIGALYNLTINIK